MKIWVIGRGYPTPANRMWGSFELEQAKLLARNGHDVSYIALTLSFFSRKDPRGMRKFEENGVKVFAYSHLYFPGKLGIYWERFEDKCWERLFAEAEKTGGTPDAIHVHYPSMMKAVNGVEKYRAKGVKLFATEHWSRVLINTLKQHEKASLAYYTSHANCFACVSRSLQEAVEKLVDVRVPEEIIPNIVSPVFFEADPHKKTEEFTFITVGRMLPVKQFDVILEQFLKAFAGNETVRLKMIGSGEEKSRLEGICKGDTRVSFPGEVRLAEVAREIAKSDVLVSFSRYETFAVPVTEAWACGKPVIISDKSGAASYVDQSLGLVIPANSCSELEGALKYIYENYEEYSVEHMREFARDHFSDKVIMNKLNQMYMKY